MAIFNIICGISSIIGLVISIFTCSEVIKISKNYNCDNENTKIINKNEGNTYYGHSVGRDIINGDRYCK